MKLLCLGGAGHIDTVESVRVSHGAYRPIAFSDAIAETTTYEYDPALPGRVVFEDGAFKPVPPFARPRDIALPAPYGTAPQYIIPHAETRNVGIPFAIGAILLAEGRVQRPGVLTPEEAFPPQAVFAELAKRRLFIHEHVAPGS